MVQYANSTIEMVNFVENARTIALFRFIHTATAVSNVIQRISNMGAWVHYCYLPLLTIFYILVIMFRISVNSSSLNGFILVSQLTAIPPMIRIVYDGNQVNPYFDVSYSTQLFVDLGIEVYAVWNLDFFQNFINPSVFIST